MNTELLDCGHANTYKVEERAQPGYCGGTGYATTQDGKRICYACSAADEKQFMIDNGRTTLYLSEKGLLTDWPGQLQFKPLYINIGEGFGFGRHYPIYTGEFNGPDGFVWSFRNAGNMQLARCKRTKRVSNHA